METTDNLKARTHIYNKLSTEIFTNEIKYFHAIKIPQLTVGDSDKSHILFATDNKTMVFTIIRIISEGEQSISYIITMPNIPSDFNIGIKTPNEQPEKTIIQDIETTNELSMPEEPPILTPSVVNNSQLAINDKLPTDESVVNNSQLAINDKLPTDESVVNNEIISRPSQQGVVMLDDRSIDIITAKNDTGIRFYVKIVINESLFKNIYICIYKLN